MQKEQREMPNAELNVKIPTQLARSPIIDCILDEINNMAEKMFFSTITESTIETLGPRYD